MPEVVYTGGGFGGDRPDMSDSLRARIAQADAQQQATDAVVERQRQDAAARRQDDAVASSIAAALGRNEVIDVLGAIRRGGVGHTRSEFIAIASAQADLEDAQQNAARAKRLRDWEVRESAQSSIDTTVPTQSERAERRAMETRAARYAAKHPRDNAQRDWAGREMER